VRFGELDVFLAAEISLIRGNLIGFPITDSDLFTKNFDFAFRVYRAVLEAIRFVVRGPERLGVDCWGNSARQP
jgi:hypothetical protein